MSRFDRAKLGLLNTDKAVFAGIGQYDFPMIYPTDDISLEDTRCIGFNFAMSEKHPEDCIVHFFMDDYQFSRIWTHPDMYVPVMQRFKYVIAPDFSMYTDHPKALQLFNHYRKHWLAAYWQSNGVEVIPCICWSDESSFEWCFDGVPEESPICISTVGGFTGGKCKEGWLKGFNEAIKRLNPSQLIIFGKEYDEIKTGIPTVVLKNEQLVRKKRLSREVIA